MSQAVTIRTTLIFSFMLLVCNSGVNAQESVTTVVGKQSAATSGPELNATSNVVVPGKRKGIESEQARQQPDPGLSQARPGERVTNPAHEILNLDTKQGGVEIKGTGLNDYGYLGPGDMRTHLWNSHSKELVANGITEYSLMAMAAPEVQKWHNYFHGVEGSPEHPHDDHELDHSDAIAQSQTMPTTPTYVEHPIYGTIVVENSGQNDLGNPQLLYEQPGNVYEQGVIIDGASSNEFKTEIPPTIFIEGFIQSEPFYNQQSSRRVERE